MDEYKNFYFLHIPKCGGRYVKSHILSQLKDNINRLPVTNRHEGWSWEINDDTYVFTILRDPVKFACSLYAHEVMRKTKYIDTLLEVNETEYLLPSVNNIHLDKKYLFIRFQENQWMKNLQSKHILHGKTKNKDAIDVIKEKYTFTDQIDKDLLYKRLDRINLLVRQTSLYNPEPVVKRLCNDLNIKIAGDIKKDHLTYHSIASDNLYNSLTEEDKKWIEDFFAIDVEIYNNHSIFTQLDNVCSFCGRYAYTTHFDTNWKKYSFCVECVNSRKALIG